MTPVFLVSDVKGMKQITSDHHTFVKDLSAYEHVNIYGRSLVSTDGNEWRRHLTVARPPFSESNNAMVWREVSNGRNFAIFSICKLIFYSRLGDSCSNGSRVNMRRRLLVGQRRCSREDDPGDAARYRRCSFQVCSRR
jgi:hypothetical protein